MKKKEEKKKEELFQYPCNFCGKKLPRTETKVPNITFNGLRDVLMYECCFDCMEEILTYFRRREDFMRFKAGEGLIK